MEKKAHSENFATTKQLAKFLNENQIPNSDIAGIIVLKDELFLIYYC